MCRNLSPTANRWLTQQDCQMSHSCTQTATPAHMMELIFHHDSHKQTENNQYESLVRLFDELFGVSSAIVHAWRWMVRDWRGTVRGAKNGFCHQWKSVNCLLALSPDARLLHKHYEQLSLMWLQFEKAHSSANPVRQLRQTHSGRPEARLLWLILWPNEIIIQVLCLSHALSLQACFISSGITSTSNFFLAIHFWLTTLSSHSHILFSCSPLIKCIVPCPYVLIPHYSVS